MTEVKKPKSYHKVVSPSLWNNVQVDIIIYDRFEYRNYRYILVLIDVYSRYAFAWALKTRNLEGIKTLLQELFNRYGYPKNWNSDNEFNKPAITGWLKSHDVEMYFSEPDDVQKNSIVERFNRTLASMMQLYRLHKRDNDWVSKLDKFMNAYNHRIHKSIHRKPADVMLNNKKPAIVDKPIIEDPTEGLSIGDNVRIILPKVKLQKGDRLKASLETYTVVDIVKNRYKLQDMSGEPLKRLYKVQELLVVDKVAQSVETQQLVRENEQAQVKRAKKKLLKGEHIDETNIIEDDRRKHKPKRYKD